MRTKSFAIPVALAFCFFAATLVRAQSSGPAILTIHADQTASKVSPTLYGLMTEEINHSYDGGLYAELIRNGTFRADWSGVNDWILVEDGNSAAKIGVDKTTGPSQALPYSMHVEVSQASASGPAGVLNGGYWGIPVQREHELSRFVLREGRFGGGWPRHREPGC